MTNKHSKVIIRTTAQPPSHPFQLHSQNGHPSAANLTNQPNKHHPSFSPIRTHPAIDRKSKCNQSTNPKQYNSGIPVTLMPKPQSHNGTNNNQTHNTFHPVFLPSCKICSPICYPSSPKIEPTQSPQLTDPAQIKVGLIKTDHTAVSANPQYLASNQATTLPHLKHNILNLLMHDLSTQLTAIKGLLEGMCHKLDAYLSHSINKSINNDPTSPAPSLQPLHESNPTLLVKQPMSPQNLYNLISTIAPLVPSSWHLQTMPDTTK